MSQQPEGRQGGAKAILYTILGELVLPRGGSAWTATLVSACGVLDVTERNARQALARVGEQGVIEAHRHGRQVRWHLTPRGRRLLETGAERIYRFAAEPVAWNGEWLVAHCPVPETHRGLRHRLRTRLAFEGFGELSASLAVSPHVEREPALRAILADLDLSAESVVLWSRTGSAEADADLVRRAWDLDTLGRAYLDFVATHGSRHPATPEEELRATVELVHDWRHFPSADPELPAELLPPGWAGRTARTVFQTCRQRWSAGAAAWFAEAEAAARPSASVSP